MQYGIFDLLTLAGSLGLFIYGMKIMSEGLQRAAGDGLRRILRGMTSTRVSGIFTGLLTTSLVQSSSATTVMVISFVNAGLLTLSESMGVIMGANIGTTVTAWMISIFGFKVKITVVAIILIGLVFPLMFAKKNNYRYIAEFVMGFGILFIGLDFLKDAVPNIKDNPDILEFLSPLTDKGFLSTILFIFIGTVLTIIVQSSSATMAITLVMLVQGWITFPIAAAMVLGENIGTTITANIAAIVGNVHAKRAARFHLIFNLTGVAWMILILQPFLLGIDYILINLSADHISVFGETQASRDNATLALSLFHSSFNVLNVLLLVWFLPLMERIVIKLQPTRRVEDEEIRLTYFRQGLMSTPELSLEEAMKEVQYYGKLIDKMNYGVFALLFEKHKNKESIIEKIKKREEATDNLEIELVNFLTKVSESDLSRATSERIPAMISIANDLERVADIYYQMTKNYERMESLNVKLPEEALQGLKELMDLLGRAVKLMRKNMEKDMEEVALQSAYEMENEINAKRKELRTEHYRRLEKNVYDARTGVIYLDYVNRAERIGDHLINVSEALSGLK